MCADLCRRPPIKCLPAPWTLEKPGFRDVFAEKTEFFEKIGFRGIDLKNMDAREKVAGFSILTNIGLAFKFALELFQAAWRLRPMGFIPLRILSHRWPCLSAYVCRSASPETFHTGCVKVENIIAIVSAMAIFFAGYEIVREVLFQTERREMAHLIPAMLCLCDGMGVTLSLPRPRNARGQSRKTRPV